MEKRAEKEKFQKNYEEFFRGYTPDVNSFKRYEEIKNSMKQAPPEKQTLEELSKLINFLIFIDLKKL